MSAIPKDRVLLIAVLAAIAVGAVVGGLWPELATGVGWLGDLFLNALKMLVLPLIFCSMVAAVTGIAGHGSLQRVALLAFGYYLVTTLAAVSLGLVVVGIVQPGVGVTIGEAVAPPEVAATGAAAIAESLIAPNLFAAAVEYQILPILVFALLLGMALAAVGERGQPATSFFRAANEALLKLVDWVMYAAPVGIAALLAARIGQAGGLEGFATEAQAVGRYCVAVLVGLLLHATVTLPLILAVTTRRNPLRYATNLGSALATAFATASSSATLAVTMRLTEERNQVRPETANFVLPLGATVNMDGTALYEAVAAMFIAQVVGIDLSFSSQVLVALTATLASIGAAGIPQAGLVTMVIVLEAVGLPTEGISLILAVDWFLDRCRTTVNVWGDAVGAAVVDARNHE